MNFCLFFTLSEKNVIYQQYRAIDLFSIALTNKRNYDQFDNQVYKQKRLYNRQTL